MSINESFGDLTTFYVHTGAVGVHKSSPECVTVCPNNDLACGNYHVTSVWLGTLLLCPSVALRNALRNARRCTAGRAQLLTCTWH